MRACAALPLLAVVWAGCASEAGKPAGTGGAGGDVGGEGGAAPTGGAGGTTGGSGGAPTGGGRGDGVDASSPGADSGSTAADAGVDVPLADSAAAADGPFQGTIPDAQPWQRMCPAGTSRADCCSLYCDCMGRFCPKTLPKTCQETCMAAQNWDLVCRTYQCFASQNPNFPQDHDSHCQHAIGGLGKCGNR